MLSRPERGRRGSRSTIVVGALTALLAFITTVQLRSEAEVQRTLEGEDPTQLAFLIDDLHRANDSLAADLLVLTGRRDALRSGGTERATAELAAEAARLRVVEGTVAVHGPGVTLDVEAPLSATDIQDAVNNLRAAGAEAVTVNDRRVIVGSAIRDGTSVSIDGRDVRGPWTFAAVGDPARLQSAADLMTRSLRGDSRVRRADYRFEADLVIRTTVASRPFVYAASP